jgi:hypothetical protein
MSTLEEAPTVWFWYANLSKEYGQEGKCNYRENYHMQIVNVVSFLVRCGTPCGSSQLGRYGFVKLEAPKSGQEAPS